MVLSVNARPTTGCAGLEGDARSAAPALAKAQIEQEAVEPGA